MRRPLAHRARAALRCAVSTGAAIATLALARNGRAADWPLITGTEVGAPDRPLRPFFFTQIVAEDTFAEPVHGLVSPKLRAFEGRTAAFNTIAGSTDATWGLSVRRARPGLRGSLPGTHQRVTYFTMVELGRVGVTRMDPVALTDAAVTLSYLPGARIRAGQFKLPIMDEVVESNPLASEFIDFTSTAVQLLGESRVEGGKYTSGLYGFRDVGVEAFDTFQVGKVALAYALMVSNGRMGALENDDLKDVSGRVTTSWVFRGKPTDPHRQELSVFAWGLHGKRRQDGLEGNRNRAGAGVHLELEPVRVRAELVHAEGMLQLGAQPPFEGEPIAVAAYGQATGGYVQARVRLFGHLLLGARYEELHRQTEDPAQLRIFRTLTPAAEWQITPKVRLMLNYQARWISAPHGNADARTIVGTVGDRVVAQLTAFVP